MREILFRGKRVDNGKWVEGYVREIWASKQEDCRYVICPSKSYENDGWADSEETEVISETVGQFTGLTDKNGKKIFEMDILVQRTSACSDLPGGVVIPDELYAYWKVLWDDRTNGFNSFPISSLSEEDFNVAIEQLGGLIQWPSCEVLSNCWHYEVIGNINDNPELLEQSSVSNTSK
jgi:uncharacterized phage protein (TIGR01671 family)